MKRIILIGYMGSGKTTVGRALAKELGLPFYDLDWYIESRMRKKVSQIFAEQGEEGFRRRETAVLAELGKLSGTVLSTGGGCVTRPENYPLLHQNGRIIWIQRDLSLLETEGRPLSQAASNQVLFARRKPCYAQFADMTVENNTTVAEAAERVLALL